MVLSFLADSFRGSPICPSELVISNDHVRRFYAPRLDGEYLDDLWN